jgi:hypothetical protein
MFKVLKYSYFLTCQMRMICGMYGGRHLKAHPPLFSLKYNLSLKDFIVGGFR